MEEIWRPCKDYEGLYEVSNLGRVRSCDKKVWNGKNYYFKEGKLKTPELRKDGYLSVSLYKDNKGKHMKIHRLVAFAFIENANPELYNDVNHIDCDRTNNTVDNLEWCNAKTNHEHSDKLGRKTKPPVFYGTENKFSTPVYATLLNTGETMEFISITEGLIYLNVKNPYSKVSNVFKAIKRNGTAYGCKWKLKES